MCQTFNAKPLEKVLKPSSWLNLFNYEFLTKVINEHVLTPNLKAAW